MACQPSATQFLVGKSDAASPVLPAWIPQMGVVEVVAVFMGYSNVRAIYVL